MKRLILMRHAKSDWSDMDASDHERRLNERGRQAADSIGKWLRIHNLKPDHVLCSDAARTRETLSRLELAAQQTTFSRALYLAEPDVMTTALKRCSEDCIMIVAHNPGCAMLAELLLQKLPDHKDFHRYPTGATLVVDFDITDWQMLRLGTGCSVHFIVPRDLNNKGA